MSDIQWEEPIQFLIIQYRNARSLALWQVPAPSYHEAIESIKAANGHRSGDTYTGVGRLVTRYMTPINLDLSRYRPRGFIVGTI